jgi:hypothetical protein
MRPWSPPPPPPPPPQPAKPPKPWFKKVKRLRIRKKDILVLRTDMLLDREQLQSLRDRATEQFGRKRIAILTAGFDLLILRGAKKGS